MPQSMSIFTLLPHANAQSMSILTLLPHAARSGVTPGWWLMKNGCVQALRQAWLQWSAACPRESSASAPSWTTRTASRCVLPPALRVWGWRLGHQGDAEEQLVASVLAHLFRKRGNRHKLESRSVCKLCKIRLRE